MITDSDIRKLESHAQDIRVTPVPQPRTRGWLRGETRHIV